MPGHIGALQEASEVGTILNACFIDGETKVQGRKVISLRSHFYVAAEVEINRFLAS